MFEDWALIVQRSARSLVSSNALTFSFPCQQYKLDHFSGYSYSQEEHLRSLVPLENTMLTGTRSRTTLSELILKLPFSIEWRNNWLLTKYGHDLNATIFIIIIFWSHNSGWRKCKQSEQNLPFVTPYLLHANTVKWNTPKSGSSWMYKAEKMITQLQTEAWLG